MALIEEELRSFLVSDLSSVTESNITYGTMPAVSAQVPQKFATIYNNGGETEKRFRFRIMTRGKTHSEAMSFALEIYTSLQRLHATNLSNFKIYMVTGQRPQQSGRESDGSYLTSADYMMELG